MQLLLCKQLLIMQMKTDNRFCSILGTILVDCNFFLPFSEKHDTFQNITTTAFQLCKYTTSNIIITHLTFSILEILQYNIFNIF